MDLAGDQNILQGEQFQNDLQMFEQYRQNQVVQHVMNFKQNMQKVDDDVDYIRSKNDLPQKQAKQEQKKLSQQEKLARELKLVNARKYFQVVKIMYLQHIVSSMNTVMSYKKGKQNLVAAWISMLPLFLLQKFIKMTQTKNLSINVRQLLVFLKEIKEHLIKQYGQEKLRVEIGYNQLFWSICQQIGLACRKVQFFAIDGMVEEVFFKLKYQASDKQRKRENRNLKEKQMIKIKLEQQIQENLQSQQSNKYLFLEDFQFDQKSFKSKSVRSSQPLPSGLQVLNKKRQQNFLRRKNYKQSYFQLFDPIQGKWLLVNSQLLEIQQIQEFKSGILEGKFIVGFYSTRTIHFRKQYQEIINLRSLKDIVIQDLSMYFCDNSKLIASRRKRIGVKPLMRQIFLKGAYQRHRLFLTNYDQHVCEVNDKLQLDYQLSIFPSNKQQMLVSQYFIIPSLLPQYCIFDPKAIPLQRQFNQQKVYLKRDLIAVTSRNGWVDKGRQVKQGELPMKKTENKSKNMTQLFLFQQTQPYNLSMKKNGDFVSDDQYNSIYVPPRFTPPQDLTIINKKISYVCTRAKIRHVQLVQGFIRTAGRILPNQIGFLVYKKDQEEIQRLQAERQAKIQQNRDQNREKQLINLWNKVFKKIQLSQWSKSFQNK